MGSRDESTTAATELPKAELDAAIVRRIREATPPNLGLAAKAILEFYHGEPASRSAAELALGDALGIDREAFDA